MAAWSECRNMAAEFNQMTPFILDYSDVKMLSTSDNAVLAKQFTYKGDQLIVAVNTLNKPLSYTIDSNSRRIKKWSYGSKIVSWYQMMVKYQI